MSPNALPPQLAIFLQSLSEQFAQIPPQRRQLYTPLLQHFTPQAAAPPFPITVVCTHNSRRSHVGQLCLEAAAKWYGLAGLNTFSGGTEATAFHPNAVKALREAGFPLIQKTEGDNPIYNCVYETVEATSVDLFSKKYDSPPNPTQDFVAIMVCKEADEACPLVSGAIARAAIPFEDPKRSDGQPEEEAAYADCVAEIGREFLWFIHQIVQQNR